MTKQTSSIKSLLLPLLLGVLPLASQAAEQNCSAVSAATCAIAKSLGRGINMGNMLEAPREGDWGVKLEPAYIDLAAQQFKTVRLPVRWTNHASADASATLDPVFAARVDTAIDAMLAKGMYVILDLHHYNQIFGDALAPNEFAVDPTVLETRLINIWTQLAQRYKDRSPKLLFELLNEPHGKLSSDAWNTLSAKLLATVRVTNPTRVVLIGPTSWNHPKQLVNLRLPADPNLIVAIHTYDPYPFTHQGLSWMPQFPAGTTCCTAQQAKTMQDAFAQAAKWNADKGVPLHLGEFGSFKAGDMASRAAYTRLARDTAESYGINWTYWELASDFGIYSPQTQTWIQPLKSSLLD
nr:glycoside hydrolase family 5 protein [uncultured Albidiferax sp.]